ncbi:MAG: NAD(P)-dependent glycerol-3-phosphate dehydrogenase [Bauldia sp.]|nr:NAD(P)-dependent glycerol-3-phosphate dehydrogenase [Bauldia sp.]
MIERVGIIGGGAWGTALALVAARAGRQVLLYARDQATVDSVNRHSTNPEHLPDLALDPPIAATADFAAAADADFVILAVPAQALRGAAAALAATLRAATPVAIAAKGIERATGRRLTEVLGEAAPRATAAVLSGPSFAPDVARGLPTAVTLAAADADLALALCRALAGPTFRPYAETDVIGVELGGALKNVLAIAAGIVAGRRLGASAGAALIARGFAEMRRFAEAFGARPETLMGLSGLGDLVLTCSSPQSRNMSVGLALGAGQTLDEALAGKLSVAEGVASAPAVRDLARRLGVETPICEAVAAVLAGEVAVDDAIRGLLSRPLREES